MGYYMVEAAVWSRHIQKLGNHGSMQLKIQQSKHNTMRKLFLRKNQKNFFLRFFPGKFSNNVGLVQSLGMQKSIYKNVQNLSASKPF